ncbi:MAG: hypothetical protein K8R58_04625 [Bacteroidales bacterium]|nr:hypothetical protein [Bacteroidales bacterium]
MTKLNIIIKIIFLFFLILLFDQNILAQDSKKPKNYSLNGHLQTLETVWIEKIKNKWLTMNAINKRMDFRWYPTNTFTAHIGMRNIMNYGQMIEEYYPYLGDYAIIDNGYLDLTRLIAKDSSYFVYLSLDRANFEFSKGNFEVKLGRQRINWSINLMWTPNDIFNTYNYFNFDYVERPGCDAAKVQYYTGMTSSVQLAYKINKDDKITFAGLYKFNKWNYDFQFLAGVMEDDLVLGTGWSGQIKGAGFNGEASYFHSKENFSDSTGVLIASTGINYTFKNSLYIHASFLFNSAGTTGPASMGSIFAIQTDISAKNFTLAKYSTFGEISYPVTPLIKANVSGIFNPNDKSVYIGPNLNFSLTENIGLLIFGQIFLGDNGTEFGDYGKMFYMRLKWSF